MIEFIQYFLVAGLFFIVGSIYYNKHDMASLVYSGIGVLFVLSGLISTIVQDFR